MFLPPELQSVRGRGAYHATAAERVKLTYEDFLEFPDDGLRHELIDGEHYVTPSPGSAHQLIVGNLYLAIGIYLKERPVGVLMLSPFDIVLSQYDVVEPDLDLFLVQDIRRNRG